MEVEEAEDEASNDRQSEFEKLTKDNFNLKLRIFYLEERLAKLGGNNHDEEKEDENEDASAENLELKALIEEKDRSLAERNNLLLKARSAIESLQNENRMTKDDLGKERSSLAAVITTRENEIKKLEETNHSLRLQIQDYENCQVELRKELQQKLETKECNTLELNNMKNQLDMAQNRVKSYMEKLSEADAKNQQLERDIAIVKGEMKTLNDKNLAMENMNKEARKFLNDVEKLKDEAVHEKERLQKLNEGNMNRIAMLETQLNQNLESVNHLKDQVLQRENKMQTMNTEIMTLKSWKSKAENLQKRLDMEVQQNFQQQQKISLLHKTQDGSRCAQDRQELLNKINASNEKNKKLEDLAMNYKSKADALTQELRELASINAKVEVERAKLLKQVKEASNKENSSRKSVVYRVKLEPSIESTIDIGLKSKTDIATTMKSNAEESLNCEVERLLDRCLMRHCIEIKPSRLRNPLFAKIMALNSYISTLKDGVEKLHTHCEEHFAKFYCLIQDKEDRINQLESKISKCSRLIKVSKLPIWLKDKENMMQNSSRINDQKILDNNFDANRYRDEKFGNAKVQPTQKVLLNEIMELKKCISSYKSELETLQQSNRLMSLELEERGRKLEICQTTIDKNKVLVHALERKQPETNCQGSPEKLTQFGGKLYHNSQMDRAKSHFDLYHGDCTSSQQQFTSSLIPADEERIGRDTHVQTRDDAFIASQKRFLREFSNTLNKSEERFAELMLLLTKLVKRCERSIGISYSGQKSHGEISTEFKRLVQSNALLACQLRELGLSIQHVFEVVKVHKSYSQETIGSRELTDEQPHGLILKSVDMNKQEADDGEREHLSVDELHNEMLIRLGKIGNDLQATAAVLKRG